MQVCKSAGMTGIPDVLNCNGMQKDEWQFDYIIPKINGGTKSYFDCLIISRKYNRAKLNNRLEEK